jgi:AraC-like DNA-binding protein
MLQDVGLSPKRALRIARLQRALAGCQRLGAAWVDLAARCGFADQAHMVREFQDLLGESPTTWISRSALPIHSRQGKSSHGKV